MNDAMNNDTAYGLWLRCLVHQKSITWSFYTEYALKKSVLCVQKCVGLLFSKEFCPIVKQALEIRVWEDK